MNRRRLILSGSLITVTAIFFTGCQKVLDYIRFTTDGKAELKICAIQNVTVRNTDDKSADVSTVHYSFYYNICGNPDSVINDEVATGNPNLVFKYDKHNRLIQFLRPYTNGSYETLDKYGYNNKNHIVYDTLYLFGLIVNNVPQTNDWPQVSYTSYVYDLQDRVVGQTDSIFVSGKFIVANQKTYTYDSKGNLILSGVVYDNKLNIKRTNAIWMFITKDYSVNNPFKANFYNSWGLPLDLPSASGALGVIAPQSGPAEIAYSCR
jgi:hypothetical protein